MFGTEVYTDMENNRQINISEMEAGIVRNDHRLHDSHLVKLAKLLKYS